MSFLSEGREKGASAGATSGTLALDLGGREGVVHDFAIQTSEVSASTELSSGGELTVPCLVAGHGRCPALTKLPPCASGDLSAAPAGERRVPGWVAAGSQWEPPVSQGVPGRSTAAHHHLCSDCPASASHPDQCLRCLL